MPDSRQASEDVDVAGEAGASLGAGGGAGAGTPRRTGPRLFVLLALLAGGFAWGGMEVYERFTHVQETDARIDADLTTVSSRVAGWVTRVAVSEGDEIAVRAVLVTIDSRESLLAIKQLEAQLGGVRAEQERLAAERQLVDRQTSSRYASEFSQMEAARVAVSSLEPQLKLARREFNRARSLFERKVFSRRQVDQAETSLKELEREHRLAVAQFKAAQAKLREAEAGRAKLKVLDGDLAMLKHRESEYRIKLERQKLDLDDRTIRSPISGVVDKTFVNVGEYVTPGQRLALIHDPEKIWIEANIKETELRNLKIGQAVDVTVDAYPDTAFTGRIIKIGNATTSEFTLLPSPNPSGNFTKITQRLPVRIAIAQRGRMLRPGMMVEIDIDLNPR